jgi:hypothetical protein
MRTQSTTMAAPLDERLKTARVAVVLPCYNEAAAIASTVNEFRKVLPNADIFVYDNASADNTAEVARAAGAYVRAEPRRGKGNVVRRMFADVDADIFVLADGDNTYDAAAAPHMIDLLEREQLDMVTGVRAERNVAAYRTGHRFGNRMLTGLVGLVFGQGHNDILSGYRVMSRRFVKSFPTLSQGFEIETELTVHALEIRAPVGEISTAYSARPEGSTSKLRTIRDGLRILRLIIHLTRDERPLAFFGALTTILITAGVALSVPILIYFLETGLVPRMPTWVLAIALAMMGALSLSVGLILDTVTRGRREMKRLAYLAIPR